MPHLIETVRTRTYDRVICLITGEYWNRRRRGDGELFTFCRACQIAVPYQDVEHQ